MNKTNQGFQKKVILNFENFAGFPTEGTANNLYYDSATGTMYYWNGTEYVAWGGSETITNIVAITDGFSYTNESGVTKNITQNLDDTDPNNQKIQTFVDGVKVFEFPLYTVNNDIQINNAGSEWSLTDDQITILETNGDSQTIVFPYRVTMVTNGDGSIDIKQNGVTIGTIPAPTADTAYSKMLFVDPINGNDTTGTGSDNKMFKTIAKALTVANGSGYRIVLGAGTYTESPTISLPNLDIVTVAGSDRGNTSINGTVTFTHTSSSSGIQGVSMTNLVHSGAGALYVTDCQVNTLLNKTSAGYIEITDTQLQGTSASTLSAGTGLIKDSLIKNMTISGASSGYTLKSNIIDADGSVTFTGGAFYNIQDNSGNINVTAGTNMELGLIASGLSSALAKQYVTDFSNKLGMLNPDSNATPTKFVTYNETTKRLEISEKPSGLPTGGTDGQVLTVQPDGSYAWENLPDAPVTGGQNVYFDSENPATGTIFDTENPPVTNNDALKEDSANTYYGTDGSVWTWNGTAYVTKTYNFTTQKRNEFTATAGQTAFTISTTPIGQLYGYRNGVKLPTAWSWVGTAVTYLPAGNGGKTIDAGDVISFEYEAY